MRRAVSATLASAAALLTATALADSPVPGSEGPAHDDAPAAFGPLYVPDGAVPDAAPTTEDARPAARSVSFGYPWRGRLAGGVHAGGRALLRLQARHLDKRHHYGTAELVGVLERAAAAVAQRSSGARLTVGELSKEGGGDIVGHRSHENGRDADLGFYLRRPDGSFAAPDTFVRVRRAGTGVEAEEQLVFDDDANWTLVEALLRDEAVTVQHVFVSDGLRRRLLRHAESAGVDRALRERASLAMMQPGRGPRAHAEHFHVRILCAPHEREVCRDRGLGTRTQIPGMPPPLGAPGSPR